MIIDGEGRVADANAEYVRMSGHERLGDILGRSVSEWTAEHDRARNAAEVGKCLATGSVRNLEVDYVHGDGRVVPIELSATVTHADGGVRISTICRDISERRESERRLLESESRYRGLFESATDGIFVLDPEGNLIDANPVAYERLGYTRQELLSMNIRQLDQREFADKVPERLALLRERGAAMFESAHRRKDGSLMPVEVNSRALDLAGGKVYFSIIRDIADRKLAEEALSEQRTLLQQILDTASIAIFLVDADTQDHPRQPADGRDVRLRAASELAGSEYTSIADSAEREAGRQKLHALLASKLPSVDLERLYRRKDGGEFWGHLDRQALPRHPRQRARPDRGHLGRHRARARGGGAAGKREKLLRKIIDSEPE